MRIQFLFLSIFCGKNQRKEGKDGFPRRSYGYGRQRSLSEGHSDEPGSQRSNEYDYFDKKMNIGEFINSRTPPPTPQSENFKNFQFNFPPHGQNPQNNSRKEYKTKSSSLGEKMNVRDVSRTRSDEEEGILSKHGTVYCGEYQESILERWSIYCCKLFSTIWFILKFFFHCVKESFK